MRGEIKEKGEIDSEAKGGEEKGVKRDGGG